MTVMFSAATLPVWLLSLLAMLPTGFPEDLSTFLFTNSSLILFHRQAYELRALVASAAFHQSAMLSSWRTLREIRLILYLALPQ